MTTRVGTADPFALRAGAFSSFPKLISQAMRSACERALSFPTLNAIYAQTQTFPVDEPFCERSLRALGVAVEFSDEDLRRIPISGPLIVVANHPFGGLDGLILAALLQRVRPDARLLANYLLRAIPEMRDLCFFVDPFGGPNATTRNLSAMRAAVRWVRAGGALGVFPAGEVSHLTWRRGCITDPPWAESLGRLIRVTNAAVLPMHFDGFNSRLFQVVGLLHPRLRTAMLPRELLAKRGRRVRAQIGSVIPYARLARFDLIDAAESNCERFADAQMTEYLRVRTYILKGRSAARSAAHPAAKAAAAPAAAPRPVIDATPPDLLATEIAALPAPQCLAASGVLCVHYGDARQLPYVLREIGRLRESTFRLVGEGTGREIDLDWFDEHYLHLFVWNAERQHIVGAYRMGQTDVLLSRFGPAGLYTSTLFNYRMRLLKQLDPALELGRSFVIPEYQRDYSPLLLLWKGIGRFVAQHPHYRRLFGAVSISDEFQSMTKQLLMAFLKAHSFNQELAALVHPRTPPRVQRFRDADERRLATLVTDVADVEELIGEIESNRRSVPVLLRQYLKLNAKLLGFNVDPDFGDVLDGLLLVDLTTVERSILNRYLGKEGAATFVDFHLRATDADHMSGRCS
ncbi:MAG: lysophospholipid acyltransferase family protein [Phycisphaerae bacterium]|nr:lysophospholipid acyltransferase family protein [Phycisphaerae bacterium]